MKKLLVLALTAVLVLTMVSAAFAAPSFSGNLREWYINSYNDANDTSLNSFFFDRVEVAMKAPFDANQGLSALLQWRGYAGDVDARLDSGFYYKKGIISKYDEFDIGALDKLPFRLGLSKNSGNFMNTGMGSKLKIGNSTGFRYELADPNYTIGFGFVNDQMKDNANSLALEGYAYSVRLDAGKNFFGLVDGLRLGVGYNHANTGTNDAGFYKMNTVIDVAYVSDLFWASLEHGGTLDRSKVRYAMGYQTADYLEAGMNFGTAKVWVGRLIMGKTPLASCIFKDTLTGSIFDGKTVGNARGSGTIIAANWDFTKQMSFYGEIVSPDKDAANDGKEFGIQFRYNF